jgi:hypothetical protein
MIMAERLSTRLFSQELFVIDNSTNEPILKRCKNVLSGGLMVKLES